MKTFACLTHLLLCALSMAQTADAMPHYRVTNLGTLPGYQASYAICLNDRGQVAGCLTSHQQQSRERPEGSRAFSWVKGHICVLPSPKELDAVASGINNRGQIVGTLRFLPDDPISGVPEQAVTWSGNRIIQIPALSPPDQRRMNQNMAIAINDAGQVACTGDDDFAGDVGEVVPHIFVYTHGHDTDLGPGCATGINNVGQISGYVLLDASGQPASDTSDLSPAKQSRAVVYDLDGIRTALGPGYALNVNTNGEVIETDEAGLTSAGASPLRTELTDALKDSTTLLSQSLHIYGKTSAYANAKMVLWRRSRAVTLPFHWLPQAINDRGWIVGSHFLWAQGRQYDLNQLVGRVKGWKIICATAINNRNDIAGWGYRHGQPRAFLLTPRN